MAQSFEDAGRKFFACADERNGNFSVDGKIIEVGEQNKAEFVIRDILVA